MTIDEIKRKEAWVKKIANGQIKLVDKTNKVCEPAAGKCNSYGFFGGNKTKALKVM